MSPGQRIAQALARLHMAQQFVTVLQSFSDPGAKDSDHQGLEAAIRELGYAIDQALSERSEART